MQQSTVRENSKSEEQNRTSGGPTVQLNLDRKEKQVLLRIVDNEGYIARQARDNLGLFSFSKKRELDEFIGEVKEIYITIKVATNDDGPLLFTGELAFSLQAIIAAAIEYTKLGVGVVTKDSLDIFEKIIEQTMLKPMFV